MKRSQAYRLRKNIITQEDLTKPTQKQTDTFLYITITLTTITLIAYYSLTLLKSLISFITLIIMLLLI